MKPVAIVHAFAVLAGLASSVSAAAELPQSGRIGNVKRATDGRIVPVEPVAPAGRPLQPLPAPSAAGAGAPAPRAQAGPTPREAACAADAILCMRVVGTSPAPQTSVPVTFGHPLPEGRLAVGGQLEARLDDGVVVPVQLDQIATHVDGSVRFAVFSLLVPRLDPGKAQTLALRLRSSGAPATVSPADWEGRVAQADFRAELALYSPQISQVVLGNRQGRNPGTPFLAGETVSIELGSDPVERFAVRVTDEMAGGDFTALSKLAAAFVPVIERSRAYSAYRIGEGGGYERFWITTRGPSHKPFEVKFAYDGKARIAVLPVQRWEPRRQFVASLRDAIANPGWRTAARAWLDGPNAGEWAIRASLKEPESGKPHPLLNAVFHVRAFPNSERIRADIAIENVATFTAGQRNFTYDVVLRDGERELYRHEEIVHFHHARWHRVVWHGEPPRLDLRYDRKAFVASKAVPNYDLQLVVPDQILAEEARALDKAALGPMGSALIEPYMPMVGGRQDIGMLPRWAALHVITQDPRALRSVIANGDAAGSAPAHYRDERTGRPLTIAGDPPLPTPPDWYVGRATLPAVANGETPWTLDTAHQPSLAYYPYLLTGDLYYLEELQFWANWNIFDLHPSYRAGARGLINAYQSRAQAWTLRTLGHAALISPDRDPMKSSFRSMLRENMRWYLETYVHGHKAAQRGIAGWIGPLIYDTKVAPWTQDYFALAMAYLADNEVDGAKDFLRWAADFVAGRWTKEAEGFCRSNAPAYLLVMRAGTPPKLAETWRELMRSTWPDQHRCGGRFVEESYPETPSGYVAIARAALAALASLGIPNARAVYDSIARDVQVRGVSYASDPTWAIVPRAAIAP